MKLGGVICLCAMFHVSRPFQVQNLAEIANDWLYIDYWRKAETVVHAVGLQRCEFLEHSWDKTGSGQSRMSMNGSDKVGRI